jgi:hypothetical protein
VGNQIVVGRGGAEGGGETLTMLSRLEVLSEALLLNEESTIPYNYNAASDEVGWDIALSRWWLVGRLVGMYVVPEDL